MSWLTRFSRKPRPAPGPEVDAAPAPVEGAGPGSNQDAQLRDTRIDRRERLYGVVRAALVNAGVQTACYKFKVLALDEHGQQFLVMVDLAPAWDAQAEWRFRIESQIIESAQTQHGLVITSVYWRNNAELATAPASVPATLSAADSLPSQLGTAGTTASRYEPIQADEVVAFQRALEEASRTPSVSRKIN